MPDLRLMAVLAHPDDESLGVGGTLAKYAAEGVETYLLCATRGERGRFGNAEVRPAPEVVGRVREAELRAAARELNLKEVHFLDYIDKDLDKADPGEAIGRIVAHLRRVKPQVVVTFAPDGGYGHPDHIAISQFTAAAIVAAADDEYRTSKFYYMAWTQGKWAAYQQAFRDLKVTVDGLDRRATPWPDWSITTRIDTTAYWQQVWRAVSCHKTQMALFEKLGHLNEEHHRGLWGSQEFYRVFSLVNSGREVETDLFEGLRQSAGAQKNGDHITSLSR
ncbi:MAG TPA: PIG-L family deacetylase [Acidobacteriota bacterium]|nr:PIG-L family deacetylase [Acidobacteriota bacterium]